MPGVGVIWAVVGSFLHMGSCGLISRAGIPKIALSRFCTHHTLGASGVTHSKSDATGSYAMPALGSNRRHSKDAHPGTHGSLLLA